MKPKALVLRTAGINCDKETQFAFSEAGADASIEHINHFKGKKDLSTYQIICIPGGFSYGDDLGAGKIFSLELSLWFKEALIEFIQKGNLILGICNGFQVLTKTGILPDLDFKQKVTLTFNDSARFEDRWVYLKKPEERTKSPKTDIWLKGLPEVITLPVAHAEGKFYAESTVLDKIEANNQVALRYTDEKRELADFPFNPNGSINNIAGITDESGRVLGLMPHPERFIFKHHHPFWQSEDIDPWGADIFKNAVAYFK